MAEGAHQIYIAPQYPLYNKVIILLTSSKNKFLLLQATRLKRLCENGIDITFYNPYNLDFDDSRKYFTEDVSKIISFTVRGYVKLASIYFQISASHIKRHLSMCANWYKSNARARRLHSSLLIPNSSLYTLAL